MNLPGETKSGGANSVATGFQLAPEFQCCQSLAGRHSMINDYQIL